MRPYVVDRQCAVVHPYVVDLLYVVDLPWVVDLPCVDDPPCGEKMRKTHYTLKNRALETDNRKCIYTGTNRKEDSCIINPPNMW